MFGYAAQGYDAADAIQYIALDPALPLVISRIRTLHDLEQSPSTPGQPSPPEKPGIGLQRLVQPLDYYIYYRRNPWVLPVGAACVIGGLIAIGYLLAK